MIPPRGVFLVVLLALVAGPAHGADGPRFVEVSQTVGLGPEVIPETVARVVFVDLDGDCWADVVVDRWRVFLNRPSSSFPGRRYVEVKDNGLLRPERGTVTVFADLDNDGHRDAVIAESVDAENPKWKDHGRRSSWRRGVGDGTFGERLPLPTPPKTTVSLSVGDVNGDGNLDLYLGNTYRRYGESLEAHTNDLLLSTGPATWKREPLPEDSHPFDEEHDLGGRPTYGTCIAYLPSQEGVVLFDMSYGRRWNRAWVQRGGAWEDIAPGIGFDGDAVRHGRHPEWLKERARTDPRFDRSDEKPFRANGNSFDLAIGDVNNDRDLDLFISEITHAWAGDSSDRSRFLFGNRKQFVPSSAGIDRVPPPPPGGGVERWNQGDLFAELADLDHDGRVDLILSSGDYPDNQRLRIFLQRKPGQFVDATEELGIDHDGSQQLSLADFDGDGDLDIIVGQTFFRFRPEQKEGRSPRLRLFRNEATEGRKSVVVYLEGDGQSRPRDPLPAATRLRWRPSFCGVQIDLAVRALVLGGHAGKQCDRMLHIGLGDWDGNFGLEVTGPGVLGSPTLDLYLVSPGSQRISAKGVVPLPR